MKRPYFLFVVIGVGIAGSAAGYWLGLRQGAGFGVALASALRGSSAPLYLQASHDAQINLYTDAMESAVDEALFINHFLEDNPAFRLLPPLWGSDIEASRHDSLTRLANYRKEHLSPQRPEALEALRAQLPESQRKDLPEITPSLRQSMLKTHETIAEMVRRYADKSSQAQ
jgi:hypothetical protein